MEREQSLSQHTNLVKTYCLLTNETLALFEFLSEYVKEPFLQAEMVDRIAQMLNYFLYHLKGSKSLNLKASLYSIAKDSGK
jgi:ubiquitin conjugation factor E4 B